jgi:hypothetical protein
VIANVSIFEDIQRSMMKIAQKHKQIYVVVWHPHTFGEIHSEDKLRHVVILQEILPTRTGLNKLRSTFTVWPE